VVGLLVASCSSTGDPTSGAAPSQGGTTTTSRPTTATARPTTTPTPSTPHGPHGAGHASPTPTKVPLRAGERFVTLAMPEAYTPKPPRTGTDDYRCFLLDPEVTRDSVVTGVDVVPGSPDVVHHVILFRVPPSQVALAEQKDRRSAGQGWTCFGGSGVESQGASLDAAPWLGAWAPGGGERVLARDLGMPLEQGSRIVMQVHYNLLAGSGPDTTAARLRVARQDPSRKVLSTVLLPAPVELPCRPGRTGPLCSREAAVADVQERFGERTALTGNYLNMICQGVGPSTTQRCTRPITEPATIRAVAGHMHLLGRSITVTLNQGKADERTVLDIPVWNFDDQGSRPVTPAVTVEPGDTMTVTCTHDQGLRDRLPAFEGQPERYVVWGEGTTDEMCLGIVMVTRP
jgi:hypothetical protein